MYVAVVLHPDCLKKEYFESEGYSTQARLLFKGIQSNGLIIVDSDDRLKRMVGNAIRGLPTQHGQRLQIWWEEFLKKPKRIVEARPERRATLQRIDDELLPGELALKCPVDAVIVEDAREMNEVALSKYDESEVEERRRSFMDGSGMLDTLAVEHADDLIIRAIRYSKWLRFYDKQIGKGGNNLKAFRRGIGHILSLWQKHGYFASDKEGQVTIYTCEADPILDGEIGRRADEKRQSNCRAYQSVLKHLIDPLRSEFPGWEIEPCVKRQIKNITHPRHLEAQAAIISFERGFDFLEKSEQVEYKRTCLHVDNKVREHLAEYRKLPEAEYLKGCPPALGD